MTRPERTGPLARPVLSLLTLAALAVLIGLGVWQLQRLEWKRALLAEIAAARSAPAVPLADALDEVRRGGAAQFRRVIFNCSAREAQPHLELHAIEDGVVGRRWITACPLEEGPYRTILLDRGFVPQEAATPVAPPERAGREPEAVVGFLRTEEPPTRFSSPPSPDETGRIVWYRRDAAAMAGALGVAEGAAPVFVLLESPSPAGGLPRPSPLPTRISNNHLGYAITWFGLAAALAGVYLAMMFKNRSNDGSERA